MQYTKLIWRDGEPYSERFDDIYYSSEQGESISGQSEFNHVFFMNNGLPQRWQGDSDFVVAELGFGSGLNCLLTIREWLKHIAETGQKKTLHYIAIEKHPFSAEDIKRLHERHAGLVSLCDELTDNYPPAIAASHSRRLFSGRVVIHYKFMDAYIALSDESLNVDAWYLDGFSPANNPELWSQRLFERLSKNSRVAATCSTYTAAGFVKRNLQAAGFDVNKVKGHGKKRDMLVARLNQQSSEPLRYTDKPWFSRTLVADDPAEPLPMRHSAIGPSAVKRATIIGSGIAGLSLAYALIHRGFSVTVIDNHDDMAKKSSENLAAIVYPRLSLDNDIDTEFYISAFCYAIYLIKLLQRNHQEKFWFGGGVLQSIDEKRIVSILDKFDFSDDYISVVRDSLPKSIQNENKVFVEYKMAGTVFPGKLCAAIKKQCGEDLTIIHKKITDVKHDGDLWSCMAEGETIDQAEVLIIANGSETDGLRITEMLPVESVRGQMIELDETSRSDKISEAVNAEVYVTPVMDGKHYVGGTYARGNDNPEIDERDTDDLLCSVDTIFPGVFKRSDCCKQWVGFRAMSKDRVPVVGAVPDETFFREEYADICNGDVKKTYRAALNRRGLYVSVAHGSRGFTSSFLSAEIIAAQITGEPSPVSKTVLDYLNPSRFIVNDLKRG